MGIGQAWKCNIRIILTYGPTSDVHFGKIPPVLTRSPALGPSYRPPLA